MHANITERGVTTAERRQQKPATVFLFYNGKDTTSFDLLQIYARHFYKILTGRVTMIGARHFPACARKRVGFCLDWAVHSTNFNSM